MGLIGRVTKRVSRMSRTDCSSCIGPYVHTFKGMAGGGFIFFFFFGGSHAISAVALLNSNRVRDNVNR